MYQHCCYVLHENIFLFLNSLKDAEKICRPDARSINFKKIKADLNSILGKHIKSRGAYTHRFPEDPNSLSMLQMIELLERDVKDHFSDARFEILDEVRSTNKKLFDFVTTDMDEYWKRLEDTVIHYNELCNWAIDPTKRSQLAITKTTNNTR
jgi:hypothetical protein